jgi:IS1 family transposase/DNA-directed RNA polymerase subunit RPC12/RpoP
MKCPRCESQAIVKNGTIHNKKQKYACKDCGRQFVENPQNKNKPIPAEKIAYIDRLLLERLALEAIARVVEVSPRWLQNYVNQKYKNISHEVSVTKKPKSKLTIECDEMWSFVQKKRNKQWVWLALDVKTREIVGAYVGKRDSDAARKLWHSLPPVYRQCAVSYTDFWEAYQTVFPKKRHKAVGKETGLTNHIERYNNTMRQRIGRLVRKTLSFSKKKTNHEGAIWNFIHHYNEKLFAI